MRAGRPLKRHALLRHANPAFQRFVFREQFQDRFVGAEQIFLVAAQRHPAKRAFAFAEQRPNKRGHKAGIIERILHARIKGALPQVVAVIKHDRAALLKFQHRLHVPRHRRARSPRKLIGIALAQFIRFFQRHSMRNVIQRIVRGRLIRHDIRHDAAQHQFRKHVRGIRNQPDR